MLKPSGNLISRRLRRIVVRGVAAATLTTFAGVAMAVASPVGTGSFSGATGHATSGSVTVTEKAGRFVIELGSNFDHDGSPDPYVALGKGKALISGGLVAVLKSNTGKQRYAIKATGALKNATHVLIWCKKYSVPIGVAPMN